MMSKIPYVIGIELLLVAANMVMLAPCTFAKSQMLTGSVARYGLQPKITPRRYAQTELGVMQLGDGTTLRPSGAGGALFAPNGQFTGTMSMQSGLPPGAVLLPSAIGPLIMGPRGEFRGTLESYSTGRSQPLMGMGPIPGYSATQDVQMVRSFYRPTPFPMSQPMVVRSGQNQPMPGSNMYAHHLPGVRGYARTIPPGAQYGQFTPRRLPNVRRRLN